MTGARLLIGLAGGTGSGKTTVAEALLAAVAKGKLALLPQDAYYRAQSEMPFEQRDLINYDEPDAFDIDLLVDHLIRLKRGEAVLRPVYDFTRDDRSGETVPLESAPVIVVEGILVLHFPALRDLLDLKVFVDAPPDERFIRRLERDISERGRSAESVIRQYRRSVKPMHDLFIEPTKQHADLIVPEGGRNEAAIDVLRTYVRARASVRAGVQAGTDASAQATGDQT